MQRNIGLRVARQRRLHSNLLVLSAELSGVAPLEMRQVRGQRIRAGLQSAAYPDQVRRSHICRQRIAARLSHLAFNVDRHGLHRIRISVNQQTVPGLQQNVLGRVSGGRQIQAHAQHFHFPVRQITEDLRVAVLHVRPQAAREVNGIH